MSYKTEFIEFMVKSEVLRFGSFTTKSGRQSPYFINTGNYKTGEQLAKLGEFYGACILANMENGNIAPDTNVLFGPAYKGIPLSVTTAVALYKNGHNVNYCFNRKEAKDHGEGGSMVGYPLQNGDKVLITEDVITAGTAVRECLPVLRNAADINVEGLIVSVDRMECGTGELTAIEELEADYGIKTFSIVNVREIIDYLHNRSVDGIVYIDDETREKMEAYLREYCSK